MTIDLDGLVPLVVAFMLVVARLTGLFLMAPVFSSPMIPVRLKVMALAALGATLTPIVAHGITPPTSAWTLAALVLKEVLVGLGLGFAVSIVFASVQLGASFIDTSVGFSFASIVDPLDNQQGSVFGTFYTMVATLAFLAIGGHEWMLVGFAKSFGLVSLTQVPDFHHALQNAVTMFAGFFTAGFQIAAPVLVTLLLCDVVLGIASRAVPQMNVFFVGVPLKIGVGLITIIIALPTFMTFLEGRLGDVVKGAGVLAGVVVH